MKKIMHFLFLSCLKATELIEKKFQVKLSVKEKIQLKMHKMMCDACSMYEKQSTLIENGIEAQQHQHLSVNKMDMDKLKHSIKEKLNNN